MRAVIFFVILALVAVNMVQSQGCLNLAGEPVSWWVMLKVPPMIGNSGYGYYDSNSKNSQFEVINNNVDAEGSPLARTLAFINSEGLQRIAWND